MVLTRAQAKAEAEAQAARGNEDDHDEDTYDPPSADAEYPDVADAYETEDMTDGPSRDTASALVVAEKSGANIFPGVEEHLEKLAGSFLVQARYLVEGHAMLQSQQEGQRRVQSAICEQFMAMQAQAGEQIKTSVTEKLFNALREVQWSAGEGLRSDDAKELVRKEVDERMTTLQRQFHDVERERQAELQANETKLRQLQAVEHAREAELQAKEAEVNHGVTEVVGERLRDPAADISAEIKQSLKRSVKTIIELISVAVDCNAQTDEEIKTEIENHGNISEDDGDENYDELSEEDRYAQQRMRDALIRA
uniref:Uncharacterized protein n=1 Tax=Phytophthora ramorum TaxID=164328 RepID=H3H584_PHYRM